MFFGKEQSEIAQKCVNFQSALQNFGIHTTINDVHNAFNELASTVTLNERALNHLLLETSVGLCIINFLAFCNNTGTQPNLNEIMKKIIEETAKKLPII